MVFGMVKCIITGWQHGQCHPRHTCRRFVSWDKLFRLSPRPLVILPNKWHHRCHRFLKNVGSPIETTCFPGFAIHAYYCALFLFITPPFLTHPHWSSPLGVLLPLTMTVCLGIGALTTWLSHEWKHVKFVFLNLSLIDALLNSMPSSFIVCREHSPSCIHL